MKNYPSPFQMDLARQLIEDGANIILGHHQDDLVENFFIRMLRGSGLKGLISLNKKTLIKLTSSGQN